MNMLQCEMLKRAIELWGDIFPIEGRTWSGCFTCETIGEIFWFNTLDKSTHVVMEADI